MSQPTSQQHSLRRMMRRYGVGDFSAAPPLATLNTNLVAYWKLDESGAGTRFDSSGNGNNLSSGGSVVQVTGKVGFATSSNGGANGGYLEATSTTQFWPCVQSGDSFTISSWVYFLALPTGFRGVISFWQPASSKISYFLWFPNNSTLTLTISNAAGVGVPVPVISPQPSLSTWHHIAFGYDNPSQTIWMQWDGSTTRQTAASVGVFNPSNGSAMDFDLCQYNSGNGTPNMYIDETGWWRRTLTPSEVALLYNGGAGRTYPFQ